MNRRTLLRLLLASGLTPLAACTRPQQAFSETIAVFGTLVRVTLYASTQAQATQAFSAINARFQHIHTDWHAWEKGGIISQINDAIAVQKPISLNHEVAAFIRLNQKLSTQTNGLFDPGIGKLIKLWGFQQNTYDHNHAPDPQHIEHLIAQHPSIHAITWDGDILYCSNTSVALDFGASGKAFALNAATDTLRQQGISNATIAIGGDIQVLGRKPNSAWLIGINDPFNAGHAKAELTLTDGEAACSSGTYERFYTDLGKKISHIINPKTGQPITHILHSTAIHNDALIAEVGALAQLIAGESGWRNIAEQLDIQHSYLITPDNKDIISTELTKRIHLA